MFVWILFSSSITASLTMAMFLSFDYGANSDKELFASFDTYSFFIIFVLLQLDMCINDIPIRWFHMIYPAICTILYFLLSGTVIGISVITPSIIIGWRYYPGLTLLVILALFFPCLPVAHTLYFGFYHLKSWLARHWLKRNITSPLIDNSVETHEASIEL